MIREALVEYCAPTLAGIKTGNMFIVKNGGTNIDSEIRELNWMLTRRGLRLLPIRRTNQTTLVYLFRPEQLKKDLK